MTSSEAVGPNDHAANHDSGLPAMLLLSEQLRTGTEWVESGRLRLRRRIVSEARTIQVIVRREELVVETHDVTTGAVGESYVGTALSGPAVRRPPTDDEESLVILLREEVPEVTMRTSVYERVTAELVTINAVAVVGNTVRHERAELDK